MWLLQARAGWIRKNGLDKKLGRIQITNGYAIVTRQFDRQYLIKNDFKDISPASLKKLPRATPKNILIIRAGGYGDILMALPTIEALKRKYPQATIDVMIDAAHFELLKNHPAINACINVFPQYIGMETEKYDEVIDFSTIIPNNPDAEWRNAYDLHFEWANLPVPFNVEELIPHLHFTEEEVESVRDAVKEKGIDLSNSIVINYLATSLIRQYPFTQARELAIKLAKKYPEKTILFLGDQPPHIFYRMQYKCETCRHEDYIGLATPPKGHAKFKCASCEEILNIYPHDWQGSKAVKNAIMWFEFPKNVRFLSTSIRESVLILKDVQLLISTDSAPLHFAGSWGTLSLGLFSSFAGQTRLSNFKNAHWIQQPFRCAPCFQHTQHCSAALREKKMFTPCLASITVEQIMQRTDKLLHGINTEQGSVIQPTQNGVQCPICKSKKAEQRLRKGSFFYYSCGKCEALYIYPPPEKKHFKAICANPASNDVFRNWPSCEAQNTEQAIELNKTLTPLLESKNAFELGCNLGFFGTQLLKDGWSYTGLDLSQDAVDTAIKRGLQNNVLAGNVYNKTTYAYIKSKGLFDCIILHQVLEHFNNPIELVNYLNPLLKVGGYFSLTMPDTSQWNGDTEWPHLNCHYAGEHPTLFSPTSMDILATTCELTVSSHIQLTKSFDFWTILKKER